MMIASAVSGHAVATATTRGSAARSESAQSSFLNMNHKEGAKGAAKAEAAMVQETVKEEVVSKEAVDEKDISHLQVSHKQTTHEKTGASPPEGGPEGGPDGKSDEKKASCCLR